MSKECTLADFTDIFDYSTGWFSDSRFVVYSIRYSNDSLP